METLTQAWEALLSRTPLDRIELPVRCRNYLQRQGVLTIQQAIPYMGDTLNDAPGIGAQAVIESQAALKDFLEQLSSCPPDQVEDFLDPREVAFRLGSEPLSQRLPELVDLLIERMNPASAERNKDILAKRFGLTDGHTYSLEEIGLFFDLTRERIRQLEGKSLKYLQTSLSGEQQPKNWRLDSAIPALFQQLREDLMQQDYILLEQEMLALIESRLGGGLARGWFMLLMNLLDYESLPTKIQGFTGTLLPAWCRSEKYQKQELETLFRALNDIFKSPEKQPLFEIVIEAKRKSKGLLSNESIHIALAITQEIESDGETIQVAFSHLNTIDKAWRVLSEAGEAMHSNDLVREINRRNAENPRYQSLATQNLVNQMIADKRFVPISKSGIWDLASRQNGPVLTIVGAIEQVLHLAGEPMSHGEITERVLELRPDAARHSVFTYLSGGSDKFSRHGRGRYGLKQWKLEEAPAQVRNRISDEDFLALVEPMFSETETLPVPEVYAAITAQTGLKDQSIRLRFKALNRFRLEPCPGKPYHQVRYLSGPDGNQPRRKGKVLLRDQLNEAIRAILMARPNQAMTKGELFELVSQQLECIRPTFYNYLNELKEFRQFQIDRSFYVVYDAPESEPQTVLLPEPEPELKPEAPEPTPPSQEKACVTPESEAFSTPAETEPKPGLSGPQAEVQCQSPPEEASAINSETWPAPLPTLRPESHHPTRILEPEVSNSQQILGQIQALFDQTSHWQGLTPRVVFWRDLKQEFEPVFDSLDLPGVESLRLTGNNYWQIKLRLHTAGPEDRLLIYQNFEDPPPERDWLLDARLYGQSFSAERVDMLCQELNLRGSELRELIAEHLAFFNSQERLRKFQALQINPNPEPHELSLVMMAVLLNQRHPDADLLIRQVLASGLDPDSNPAWQQLLKFIAPEIFYELCRRELGLREAPASLRQLFLTLAATHVAHQYHEHVSALPSHWKTLALTPTVRGFRFVDSWLHDSRDLASWRALAGVMAAELHVAALAQQVKPEAYLDCEAFGEFDKGLLIWARDGLLQPHPDFDKIQEQLIRRRGLVNYELFADYYKALTAATRLLSGIEKLKWPEIKAMPFAGLFSHYADQLWQIDQAYRHYWSAADRGEAELLNPLHGHIEHQYQRYLAELGECFGDRQQEIGFWPPAQLETQTDFFEKQPWRKSSKGENRIVVIISDALRYEVALELQDRLKTELSGSAQTEAMLGVLPSRTHFGMSALLPRPKGSPLTLDASGQLLLAGERTEGKEQRDKLLNQHSRMPAGAFKATDLRETSREDGRALVKDLKLIYIYHDQIDATGDKPANQDKVFEACDLAVNDLLALVKKLVGWNITQVLITADHGFLYQRTSPEAYDKLSAPEQDVLLLKHRCVLSRQPSQTPGLISLELKNYHSEQPVYALVPRGAQRFRLSGGSTRYSHGGAMPQEICVPVLSYQHVKAAMGKVRPKTGVQVVSAHKRITNNVFTLQLLQSEPVGENVRSRNVRVFFESDSGEMLTNEKKLELNSESNHAPDREQRIQLTVSSRNIQSGMTARLRVIDEEDHNDVVPPEVWAVNLGFINEFGF